MRPVNKSTIELIKGFEAFRSHPYRGKGDPEGVWTIGYGHTHGVTQDTPPIDEAEAERLLMQDIEEVQRIIAKTVRTTLNDNQYGALVSMVFNTGAKPLFRTLGLMINTANYEAAADEMLRWNKGTVDGKKIALEGLTIRRMKERELFITT